MDPDLDDAFWDFDSRDFGLYDVPAAIDFIVEATGRQKISLVTHSQGATGAIFGLIDLPAQNAYTEHVNMIVAMGAVTRLTST
jgi:pimeloyl-ACP methyl ester carboxylesterase